MYVHILHLNWDEYMSIFGSIWFTFTSDNKRCTYFFVILANFDGNIIGVKNAERYVCTYPYCLFLYFVWFKWAIINYYNLKRENIYFYLTESSNSSVYADMSSNIFDTYTIAVYWSVMFCANFDVSSVRCDYNLGV